MSIYEMPRLRTELIDPRTQKVFATIESLLPDLNRLTNEAIQRAQKEFIDTFDYSGYINKEYTKIFMSELEDIIRLKARQHALERVKQVALDNTLRAMLGMEILEADAPIKKKE